jgi:ATP-dependent Clp protease ATP-binding subunit ClpC
LEAARKEVLKELGVTIRPAWSLEEASHLDPSGIANELTPRAQQVLVFAGEEADRLGHVLVGTGHLLIGLIKLGSGVASNVIQELGVEAKAVRAEIERQGESEHAQRPVCDIPCTVGAEKALDLATNEAVNLNHTYVGTEHILLGLLCDRDGVAAGVFEHLGIDIERTRQEILRELGSG